MAPREDATGANDHGIKIFAPRLGAGRQATEMVGSTSTVCREQQGHADRPRMHRRHGPPLRRLARWHGVDDPVVVLVSEGTPLLIALDLKRLGLLS